MSAFIAEIKAYVEMAAENGVKPREEQGARLASPTEGLVAFGNESLPRGSSRSSSYSEEGRVGEAKVGAEEKKEGNRYVVRHLSLWLGFAAGAIRFLLKNRGGDGRG